MCLCGKVFGERELRFASNGQYVVAGHHSPLIVQRNIVIEHSAVNPGSVRSCLHHRAIEAIPGSPPDLRRLPPGCSFAPRCKYVEPACLASTPDRIEVAPGRITCCIKAGDLPKTPNPGGRTRTLGGLCHHCDSGRGFASRSASRARQGLRSSHPRPADYGSHGARLWAHK
jgi:oligopeptide/dipeptide ABC transporter ATP-binding protein